MNAPVFLAEITVGEGAIAGTALVGLGALLTVLGKWRSERASIVQEAVAAMQAAAHPHEQWIGGQPIGVRQQHEPVNEPTFLAHTREVWEVINGLRLSLARIETGVAENKVLREANAERLNEVATEVGELGKQVSRLAGAIEQHLKEHHL